VLAVPSRRPFLGVLDQLLEHLAPRRVLSCGDLGVARSLALSGTALALLPWRVAMDGAGLEPVHPELPWVEDRVHLVWRADGHRTRAASRVREAVLAAARRMPPPPGAITIAA
jgi:DNA-binding transcriptional LysR family regulator